MDTRHLAAQADASAGGTMSPDFYKAWAGELLSQQPNLKRSLDRFAQKSGVATGNPVRIRPDYRYSRVGFAYDILGVPQAVDPPALYSIGIGGTDPVLGTLDENDTNVNQGGRQDSAEMFVAHAHGFTIDLLTFGAGAVPDGFARTIARLSQFISGILHTGTQTQQEWPPLGRIPGLVAGFQNGGTAPGWVTQGASQGQNALCRLTPPIVLGAGESYKVALKIKRALGGLATLPTDLDASETVWGISHTFYGKTYTGIAG